MNELNHQFSNELRSKLKARYGKIPSCSTIARDFSLLAKNTNPISIETVRKWLNGKCVPHISRLQVLEAWLGLSLNTPKFNQIRSSYISTTKLHSFQVVQLINDLEELDSDSQQLIAQLIRSLKDKNHN